LRWKSFIFDVDTPFLGYIRLLITQQPRMNDQEAFAIAVEEAQKSFDEGGVPVSELPIKPLFHRTKGLLKHDNARLELPWYPKRASC
jgi:hypothetical protein